MDEAILTLEELTPDWIGALLRSKGIEANLSAVTATPIGTGQVGATYRLALDYAHRGPDAPDTLVAKLPSNDPLSRATGKSHMTYIREARFYQLFAGQRPLPVPEHLFISFDEESHEFTLIMRDLPHHVAGNQLAYPELDEVELAIDAAAAIHAASWGDPSLDTLPWLNGSRSVPPAHDLNMLYAMFWPGFCARYTDRVTSEMREVGDAFVGKVVDWAESRTGARCLVHNDYRPDNMLFDLDDPVRPLIVVDWQTVGVGCGAGDIAYYLGTALAPEMRRRVERELVARYCDGLHRHGVGVDAVEAVWDDYCRSAFAGFLMGVTASMVVEQTPRGDAMFLAMCERSAAMVLDH